MNEIDEPSFAVLSAPAFAVGGVPSVVVNVDVKSAAIALPDVSLTTADSAPP